MSKSRSSLFPTSHLPSDGVECLGTTFPNEDARRAYFNEKLREKLKDPAFRKIDGFPCGDDDDILALSDPPYYTACPNPFLSEFISQVGRPFDPNDKYHREPLAVDSSEGKTDAIYSAHSYHTKVPHKSIMRAILHYTSPGDVVLDGFAGSGMTGVAAQMCGHPDQEFKALVETECRQEGRQLPKWGVRRAGLTDLSPAATFIERGYNLPVDVAAFSKAGAELLREVQAELGWMYETHHSDGKSKGQINFTVWSENFACPECGKEIVFLNESLDPVTKKTRDSFPCPHCAADLTKDNLQRIMETLTDAASGDAWKRVKFSPAFISYTVNGAKYEKKPDKHDFETLARIAKLRLPTSIPTEAFPIKQMYHGSRLAPKGFTHEHHLFLPRPAQAFGLLWQKACGVKEPALRSALLFFVEQALWTASLLNRYRPTGYSQVNQYLTGVYYVASQHAECSPKYVLGGKLERLTKIFEELRAETGNAIISTGTAANLSLPDKCIDYIFTDPPFGENIFYADLNLLVESWHKIKTSAGMEAVVDAAKGKGLPEYQHLMQRCFEEYHRVLKPGRWMTVVFHNSKNAVWNAIQEAMLAAGFVVADVRTLDKQQGSYRQVTSSAVKQDLIISAYRPGQDLEERFKVTAGSEDSAWEFVRSHLDQVPGFVPKSGRVQVIAERQPYVLYDRMVAFHVQRGFAVPLSSAEFHSGLRQRFPERDGMYFLPDQVSEYDRKRLEVKEVEQYELFVSDEKSAIQWVRRQLNDNPMNKQDLQPLFMQEAQRVWEKHEKPLELQTILEQNFVEDEDGKWRVPDPRRETDLEQLRQRALMKEFQLYLDTKGKLKIVRTEALRAGFKDCWQRQDYTTIVQMGKRVPEAVIQEDQAILMYYDNALMRTGE
ncbi:MAG: DNA methylase [Ignavibacteria bacterium]|nr:DNA methylase [Ignavibacteria bacterium]